MTAPIVYKSSDGNAPVLAGNSRTCMVNLFRKCLVDGYGDKLPAGWTMPFINLGETVACFRNSITGTGFFFAVDGESEASSADARFSCYEAMSSESSGSFPIGAMNKCDFSNSTDSTPRPWILIANDQWFYFFVYYNATALPNTAAAAASSTYNLQSYFVGDFESFYATDGFNFSFIYSNPVITSASWGVGCLSSNDAAQSSSYPYYNIARAASGAVGSVLTKQFGLAMFDGASSNSSDPSGSAGTYDAAMGLVASPIWLAGTGARTFRGVLPRIRAVYAYLPVSSLAEQEIDGVPYLPVAGRYVNGKILEVLFDLSV